MKKIFSFFIMALLSTVMGFAQATVDVTYNVTFNGKTIKSATKTETVGAAPTYNVDAPAYVVVSGLPTTITEETTTVTVETSLDATVPFAMDKEYVVFFRNGANRYYWNDSDEGVGNEVRWGGQNAELNSREELESYTETAKWTMGGDWMNGFTFTNAVTGNTLTAPASISGGTVCNLDTEDATGFDIQKQDNGFWRFYVHGQRVNYLAHTSHGSHRVTFWNVSNYGLTAEGGAGVVQFEEIVPPAPITEVETKTVTISFVKSDGSKWMINNDNGTANVVEYVEPAPESAKFVATLWSNDKYTYTNEGLYLGYGRMDSEFKAIYNYWTCESLEGVENNFITATVPEGSVYLTCENRREGNTQTGVLILKEEDNTFNNTSAPYFNGSFTSALLVEEVAAPEPEPTVVTFEFKENEDGTITVTPSDLEATYFIHLSNATIDGAYGFADKDESYEENVGYVTYNSEVHTGVTVFDPVQWMEDWYWGYFEYAPGEWWLMAGLVTVGEPTEDGAEISATKAAEPTVYTYTVVAPEPEPEPEVTFPVEGKAYVVLNNDASLYLNIVADETKAAVLTAQPEKIFFEKKNEGWLIKDEEGNMIGGHAKDWNVANNIEQLWNVVEVEGGYAFQRTDDNTKYLGFDKIEVNPDDFFATAGFRDKNYTTHHGVFTIFEYTFPLQHTAYKVKNVDASLYMNISAADAKNTTIEKTPEEIFFTVAEDGGFYIQDKEGNYVGAGANDWTVANTPATWNVVEVEGGYAFQRTDATSKYLGLDSVNESSAYFRDKGAAAHYAHLIMLFDTPETTPQEDLAAAIEAAKAVKAEDYASVPEDLFVDLAAEIEKAEALAAKGEDATVSDINDEIAALDAAVKAITEYTEPAQEELVARLEAALAAAEAAVKANYSGETLLAGKPGYKAADLVAALEAAIATYGEFEGELTRANVVEVEHAVRAYDEALPLIPEVGKTYAIYNQPGGLNDSYAYVMTAGENGLELNRKDKISDFDKTHLWTVSEHLFKVEDDWGDVLFEETRYVFKNAETGQIFGFDGAKLGLCENETDMNCWYFTQKNPKEKYAGSVDMPYGTLGLQYNDGGNKYKFATVNMIRESLTISGSDVPMHRLWTDSYSSYYIFEEVDLKTVGLDTVLAPATSNAKVYDLQGRRHVAPVKGLFIENGKKVIR